jgi:hypothetical protein
VEVFFAAMKQSVNESQLSFYFSRTVFCFNEAKAGDFLLRRSKVMTLVSDEHCVTWSYFFLFPDEPFLLQ